MMAHHAQKQKQKQTHTQKNPEHRYLSTFLLESTEPSSEDLTKLLNVTATARNNDIFPSHEPSDMFALSVTDADNVASSSSITTGAAGTPSGKSRRDNHGTNWSIDAGSVRTTGQGHKSQHSLADSVKTIDGKNDNGSASRRHTAHKKGAFSHELSLPSTAGEDAVFDRIVMSFDQFDLVGQSSKVDDLLGSPDYPPTLRKHAKTASSSSSHSFMTKHVKDLASVRAVSSSNMSIARKSQRVQEMSAFQSPPRKKSQTFETGRRSVSPVAKSRANNDRQNDDKELSSSPPAALPQSLPSQSQPQDRPTTADTSTWTVSSVDSTESPPQGVSTRIKVTTPVHKERPGLLRRIFGSSRSITPLSSELNLSSIQVTSDVVQRVSSTRRTDQTDQTDEHTSQQQQEPSRAASILRSQTSPPQIESSPAMSTRSYSVAEIPTLNSKASFFRRRRKSTAEDTVPDLPQNLLQNIPGAPNSTKGSIGSFTEAMTQFLARPATSSTLERDRRSTIRHVLPSDTSAAKGDAPLTVTPSKQNVPSGINTAESAKTSPPSHSHSARRPSGSVPIEPQTRWVPLQTHSPKGLAIASGGDTWTSSSRGVGPFTESRKGSEAISLDSAGRNQYESSTQSGVASTMSSAPSSPPHPPHALTKDNDTAASPVISVPDENEHEIARALFNGYSHITSGDIASWLGDNIEGRAGILHEYMNFFDWKDCSILTSLRMLCEHTVLKAESQQLDRIIDAFSLRWCECNPNHGFKKPSVVHAICFSLLLLNTDLHSLGVDSKMTKGQFVKNTLVAVRRILARDSAAETIKGSSLPGRPSLVQRGSDTSVRHELVKSPFDKVDECGPFVKSATTGTIDGWEPVIEIVLKDFYSSIRNRQLPLHNMQTLSVPSPSLTVSSGLSAVSGMIKRSPSILSKGSDAFRGRTDKLHVIPPRWTARGRSKQSRYTGSTPGSMSRVSLDDEQSPLSTGPTSAPWTGSSLGRSQTGLSTMSVPVSESPTAEYQRSIGFANALSHAITRKETGLEIPDVKDFKVPTLADEDLGLYGSPWAKEGPLKHKHYSEGINKRSRDKRWTDCFVVVEKGFARVFILNSARSARNRSRPPPGGSVVGGGNWMNNAELLHEFALRHTIASELPAPGYSPDKPYVWCLSLPTGATHLFQCGTAEIVQEYVSTANYWSARMSKEPLMGAISNIEYGWSPAIVNMALVTKSPPKAKVPLKLSDIPTTTGSRRPSFQSSMRSSIDQITQPTSSKTRPSGDKANLGDWHPPQQSILSSSLSETQQLRSLQSYIKAIQAELDAHKDLRSAMQLAYSPRSTNLAKALTNWEKKSNYLMREVLKYDTYVKALEDAREARDVIEKARVKKEEVAKEGKLEEDDDDDDDDDDDSDDGHEDKETERGSGGGVTIMT